MLGGEHPLDLVRRPGVAAGLDEMRAVVGENRVNLVRNGRDQGAQEVACDTAGDLLMQLDEGDLGRAVDRNKQRELALMSMWKKPIGSRLNLARCGLSPSVSGRRAMPWR